MTDFLQPYYSPRKMLNTGDNRGKGRVESYGPRELGVKTDGGMHIWKAEVSRGKATVYHPEGIIEGETDSEGNDVMYPQLNPFTYSLPNSVDRFHFSFDHEGNIHYTYSKDGVVTLDYYNTATSEREVRTFRGEHPSIALSYLEDISPWGNGTVLVYTTATSPSYMIVRTSDDNYTSSQQVGPINSKYPIIRTLGLDETWGLSVRFRAPISVV